jgi:hypothetical protein
MQRTADFYDSVVNTHSTSSTSTLNSLSPTWIAEGSISGGIWGPCTDLVQSARAVADSYRFGQRFTDRTYPAHSAGEADVHFETEETRSLVFRRQVIEQNGTQPGFLGVHVHDRDQSIERSRPSQSVQPESCKQEPSDCASTIERITEDELNAEYVSYLEGSATAEDVLAAIIGFVQAKLETGYKEFDLRERGADDILGEFWAKMESPVHQKRFKAENGSKFSWYVKSAWSNLRADVYEEMNDGDKRFSSSTPDPKTDPEDFDRSVENDHALVLYKQAQNDTTREAARLTHEIKSMLSDADTAILEALLDTPKKTVVAKRLGLNRHVVDRAQVRIQTAHARAILRLSSGKVA